MTNLLRDLPLRKIGHLCEPQTLEETSQTSIPRQEHVSARSLRAEHGDGIR